MTPAQKSADTRRRARHEAATVGPAHGIDFRRRVVVGTPVTPRALLPTLAGGSFCVSFADPRQLDECVELVGDDGFLMLDNGAFTHWRQGRGQIDRAAFWEWANWAQFRCPVAVAVIPDVIEGSERDNLLECSYAIRDGFAEFPERTMPVWHLNDSLGQLETFCRLFNFVAFGSCAQFDVSRKRRDYLARMREASAVVDAVELEHGRRPWLHLMRGLDVLPDLIRFESADSTNVAMNHNRHRSTHGDARARFLRDRTQAAVDHAADHCEVEECAQVENFTDAPTARPAHRVAG